MPKKAKRNKALAAYERRGLLQHVLFQNGRWMTVSALRRFVDARRPVVEQDIKRLGDIGSVEVSSVRIFNPGLDRCQDVMMARAIKDVK